MIKVLLGGTKDLAVEAILRSIYSNLEADTPFSRDLELKAGSSVTERLQATGDLPIGAAAITPGGDTGRSFLIHVVVQSAAEPVTPEGIRSALRNGLRRAEEWGLESLALPPLGTGAGNLETDEVAAVMVPLLVQHLRGASSLSEISILVSTTFEEDVFNRAIEWHSRDHKPDDA
ncbi:MAG: macro domain-containing protein [Gemmatimonadota bacterium]|jgi:O-acetyl-ADP-ribose deacetylase (regulator of RNase III)